MRSFIWHDYHDNELNQRILFINDENDKTLTIYYDDIGYMITAPYEP